MSTERPAPTEIRASDAERDRVAALIQRASAEGRLTIAESDERLRQLYATTYRHELEPLTVDLPHDRSPADPSTGANDGEPRRGRGWSDPANRGLRIHIIVAAVLSALLIVRWTVSGVPYFWPMFPMFWIWVTVAIHARWSGGPGWLRRRPPWTRRADPGV